MTVAHGFGEQTDEGRRTTATSLPRVRDGPFVVFAPADHPAPGALGTLAVAGELWGVVVRNLALFVGVPGAVFTGGILAVHQFVGPPREAGSLRRTAGLVVVVGLLIVVAVLWIERPWEYHSSTQAWFALAFGAALIWGGARDLAPPGGRHVRATSRRRRPRRGRRRDRHGGPLD